MPPFRRFTAHRNRKESDLPGKCLVRKPLPSAPFFAACLFAAILLFVVLSGCDDDAPPSCPAATGHIAGRILSTAPVPAGAKVTAMPVNRLETPHTTVTATPDSTGRYAIDLPPGMYFLHLVLPRTSELWYSHGEVTGLQARAEILHVAAGTDVRADFLLGGLTVQLDLPDSNSYFRLLLVSTNPAAPGECIVAYSSSTDRVGNRIEARFPALPPRTWRVRFEASGSDPFWLPGTWDPALADTVAVTRGTTRIRCPRPGAISGMIGGAYPELAGMLLPGPDAELYNEDSTQVGWSFDVARNGAFRIRVPIPGTYKVLFRFNGFRRWIGGPDWETATPFVVTEGQEISGVEVPVAAILCRLEGPGMQIGWSAELCVYDAAGRRLEHYGSTAWETEYRVACGLRPGTWFVKIEPGNGDRFLPVWYESADSLARATPIVITSETETVRITVPLRDAGGVR